MQVLLDTNFVLAPMRYSFNIEHEFSRLALTDFLMIKECLLELLNRKDMEKLFARKILIRLNPKIIEIKNKKIINKLSYHDVGPTLNWSSDYKSGYCDEAILRVAKDYGFAVATLDKKLMSELIKQGVRVITLRNNTLRLL